MRLINDAAFRIHSYHVIKHEFFLHFIRVKLNLYIYISFSGLIVVWLYLFHDWNLVIRVHGNFQKCSGKSQYDQCSANSICGCFHTASNSNNSICGFLWVTCSELNSCGHPNNMCYEPNHICVHHPRCFQHPICYPLSETIQEICPPIIGKTKHEIKWRSFHFVANFIIRPIRILDFFLLK